jgi:hypothetical protein
MRTSLFALALLTCAHGGARSETTPAASASPDAGRAVMDSDGDGITDECDRCPSEPEDPNCGDDWDGCPDRPRAAPGSDVICGTCRENDSTPLPGCPGPDRGIVP